MITHEIIQGTPEWHVYRREHWNASDAPAMMGCSPYKSRNQLLHEMHTGIADEVDSFTQKRFDDGHRFEALARAIAEQAIGQELYPVTGSVGKLSASFDGLTLDDSIVYEHKTLNDEIRKAKSAMDLALYLRVQMEQQLAVSGAEKVLFVATKWGADGTLAEEPKILWYTSDHELRKQIIAGWDQFEKDLAAYVPRVIEEAPKAEAILSLPALAVHIRGEVTASNLPEFKAAAESFIASINTDLKTDDDFANAEAVVKFCDKAEKDLELTKKSAIAQTASIDELMRTVDFIKDQLRTKRLSLNKLIDSKKETIKTDILNAARIAWIDHLASLEAETKPTRLILAEPDFAGAMKGKRTLESLHDAVDTTLAQAKIAADDYAKQVRSKLNWFKGEADGYAFLFMDMQQIVSKPIDDFQLLVKTRIDEYKREQEAIAARSKAEEEAKAAVESKAQVKSVEAPAIAEAAQEPTRQVIKDMGKGHSDYISEYLEWKKFDVPDETAREIIIGYLEFYKRYPIAA